ncbi:OmpA family protein [Glutamicibacter halophytocola]|uniref:OmpA family protein n=1 Tax=Glutamicibacter halophytocola TaxID=1933880 RepID=UPI0009FEB954|nr:OmpA family protein [Glutamicibacter halophytocola]
MKALPVRLIGAGVLLAALGCQLPAAQATATNAQELPEPSSELIAKSVRVWDPGTSVLAWNLTGSVKAVEQVQEKDGETTITLATDILFTPDSSKLPATASAKVESLVSKIPKGADVQVNGHTDSVHGAKDNKALSTDRAKAVAAVLKKARPDLNAKVKGFADTQPAVREDPKDLSTYAANRRVEIIYAG